MAQKVTTVIVYFFAGVNAGAYLLQQFGIDDLLGIGVATGGHERTQQVAHQYESVPTGNSIGGTLIGLYNTVTTFFTDLITYIFPAMDMLANLGVANEWIVFLSTIAGIAFAFDAVSVLMKVNL